MKQWIVVVTLVLFMNVEKVSAFDIKVSGEVTNVYLDKSSQSMHISGWGLVNHVSHLRDQETHQYQIELRGSRHVYFFDAIQRNMDLTEIGGYRGQKKCDDKKYRTNCNYELRQVGYHTSIELSKLKEDQYAFYLHLKIGTDTFTSPMYFYTSKPTEFSDNRFSYHINSSLRLAQIQLLRNYVVARSQPYIDTNTPVVKTGKCVNNLRERTYYAYPGVFNNVIDIVDTPKGKSYAVMVSSQYCEGSNEFLGEGTHHRAYIPSIYIGHSGEAMRLLVSRITKPVTIYAHDRAIKQYSVFYAYDGVYGIDQYGNKDPGIKVLVNNVNTRIPGHYTVTYEYQTAKKSIKVEVIPVKTRFRYIEP